jgi:hypothetical protein
MTTKETKLSETVRNGIVSGIRTTGDITKATADTVSGVLATTLKDVGKVGGAAEEAVGHVAGGAVHGATEIGAHLGHSAKGIVVGVLRGTKHIGVQAMDTIGHTAGAVIHNAAEVGGDLGHAATGLVEGAVHSAKELGVSGEEAASAAARGALRAADKVGTSAVETVRHAVTQTIAGVRVVLKEPFKTSPKG